MSIWHSSTLHINSISYKQISMYNSSAKGRLRQVLKRMNTDNNEFICAVCGAQPIDKHHENYDVWYSFIPLCKRCHGLTRGNRWKQARLKRLVTECQNDSLER